MFVFLNAQEDISVLLKAIEYIGKFIEFMQTWNNYVRAGVLFAALFFVLWIVKKVKLAGKIMNILMGVAIFLNILQLAGFELAELLQAYLDTIRYAILFFGLG